MTLARHKVRLTSRGRIGSSLRRAVFAAAMFLAAFGLAAQSASAQTMLPLPNYGSTYTANQIRGYWFQAPADFTIVGVRVPTDIGTTPQNVQIIRFLNGAPPVYAASTNQHVTLGLWTNVNTTTMIPCNIDIQAGDYIAVFGTRTNGTNMNNSYATPSGPYTSNIFGLPVTLTRMVYQAGSFPVTDVSQEVGGQIARTELYYAPTIKAPNDAGVASIDSPVNFCAGTNDVKVTLRNFGMLPLTSVTINWKLNGVTQTPYSWTGLLDTTNIAARQTQVTLATQNFLSGITYAIDAWTTMPNGVVDTVPSNDSASVITKAAISGTFTIGGASPDYTTFGAAIADLNANGVCGPVVFNVRSGTYPERFSVKNIAGASAVNTITFQSETGDSSAVIVSSAASTSAENYILQLDGAKYVTFKDMTITTTNATYACVVDIRGGSEYNMLDNLELIGVQTTSTSQQYAVVSSPSGSLDHNNTIQNCSIRNGSVGLFMYGSGTTSTENNVTIQGNYIGGFYYTPVYLYYLGELNFLDNVIEHTSAYTSKYNGMFYYGFNTQIERNTFRVEGGTYSYGVYIYYDNYYQTGSSRFVNNFITSSGGTSTTYGVRPYYCYNLLFAHNTILINSTYTSSYAVYSYSGTNQRYLNNIMAHAGAGRAWYVSTPSAIIESDYNDIYVSGPVLAYWAGDRANITALKTASGMDQNSISKPATFANTSIGDLHLAAPSDDDDDMIGTMLTEVGDDIDGDTRVRPYRGADEACYLIPNSLTYEFVDGTGNPTAYVEVPGTIGVHYTVIFPDFDANIQMTLNFYSVNDGLLKYSTSFAAYKPAGQTLDGTQYITVPGTVAPGFYRVELVFNTKNSCGYYRNYMPYPTALMLIEQGNIPCEVWPGDVNNDGVVNYTDRKDLNVYIHDANLRTLWLYGPARYRADAAQDPLTYLRWQPQAGVPWYTPEGCYMDADGNGVINNFDYIAIKLNWMRTHGAITPKHDGVSVTTFDMSQNYPNPFNPSTTIVYSVPERSNVQLRIVDMLGRLVDMPVDGMVEAGSHTLQFDGSQLPSGQYLAIVFMTGLESGTSFEKTVKMTLAK